MNFRKSFYDELRVVRRTPVIEQKSLYGLSAIRDIWSGDVTSDNVEYKLTTDGSSPNAVLDTAERGPYPPGQQVEVGTAFRFASRPEDGHKYRVGYYDDSDGWFYEYDHVGLFLVRRRDGTDSGQKWGRWVSDTVLQKGNLITEQYAPADGHSHNINFTWYGFGPGEFSYQMDTPKASGWMRVFGWLRPKGQTSIKNPHLPVRAEVIAAQGTGAATAYLAGRQVNVVGEYNPIFRNTSVESESVSGTAVSVSETEWTPVLAVRRENLFPYALSALDVIEAQSTVDVRMALLVNPTMTGVTWNTGGITDIPSGETLLQEASALPAAQTTIGGFSPAWARKFKIKGGASGNKTAGNLASVVRAPMIEQQPFMLVARSVAGQGAGTISVTAQFREDY